MIYQNPNHRSEARGASAAGLQRFKVFNSRRLVLQNPYCRSEAREGVSVFYGRQAALNDRIRDLEALGRSRRSIRGI
jgi:hypothetical protein